ncbi:MAG: hypothetical protein EHM48_06165, partial [Planctomycetaceae bacterium]
MIHHRVTLAVIGISMLLACGQWASAQVRVDVGGVHIQVGDDPRQTREEIVVLTRGPIHEAFAQPVVFDDEPEFVITRRPPSPLDEIVPDERPQGRHITWIPGYWSWDSDRDDFIWVSGCWRAIPPKTSWVPGYWAKSRNGYQWVGGFWYTADNDEIEYLPAPPDTLDEGPQGIGNADSVWIPGCWVRYEGRYAWRPGFWETVRPNWVWEPAHYVRTPRGWVYVEGYWDYSLDRRGVAFLPVYCPPSLYGRRDFRYSPDVVLDLDVLTLYLFSSPQRRHYYFGDYYGDEYSRAGYRPWYTSRDHHDSYDPIFVYEQWNHRDDRKWADNQRSEYERRRDDKNLRPARTYDDMKAKADRTPEKDRRQVQTARPIKDVVSSKTTPFKFDKQDDKAREATANQAKDARNYRDKRSDWEAPKADTEPKEVVTPREPIRTPPTDSPKPPVRDVTPPDKDQTPDRGTVSRDQPTRRDIQPEKVKITRSPVTVREPVTDKDLTPPVRPTQPKLDPDAKPRPRKVDSSDRSKDSSDKSSSDKGKDSSDTNRDKDRDKDKDKD